MTPHKFIRTMALSISAMIGAVLALIVTSSAAASPSSSHTRTDRVITWKNDYFHGQYLQISHSSTSDNAWTEVRHGPGDANEHWDSIYLGNGQYAFKNLNSHKCLTEFNPNTPGRHVIQRGCERYPTSRRWTQRHIPGTHFYQLYPVGGDGTLAACADIHTRWVTMGNVAENVACFWY